MQLAEPIAAIVAFLDRIGIPTTIEPVRESLIPGATVRNGALVFDPALPCPGDLLHEAGHIAVTDPALRAMLTEVPDDPAEEMAAIAWSYAAALEIGLDPGQVFHGEGYRGGGAYLLAAMAGAGGPGVPVLQYYGMTAEPHQSERLGLPAYPAMARWLR